MRRQAPNVERMELLGAEVRPVEFGTRTLKEATSEAIRDWITNVETTHYLIGSCVGPAPYPEIVRDLQSRDRPRGARAVPRGRGPAARGRRRLRRRRLERDRRSSPASSTTPTCGWSASRPPAPRRLGTGRPACCTARARRCSPTTTGRSLDAALDLGRPRLPGRRPGARVPARLRPRRVRRHERRGGARRLPPARARPRASSRRSSRRTRSRGSRELDEELVLVCLSGRGDKDLAEVTAS